MAATKHKPVTISTFGDLASRKYDLSATCLPCNRSVRIDPATLPAEKDYIKTALICHQCGRRAAITISPPHGLSGFSSRNNRTIRDQAC